jgi:hypothetical protein
MSAYSDAFGGFGPDPSGTSFETHDGLDLGPVFFLAIILFMAWAAA